MIVVMQEGAKKEEVDRVVQLAQDTSAWLGDPLAYIQAVLGG